MRMELEALKADIQRKFIEQNTARLSVESAEERMEEAEAGSRSLMEELKEMEKQVLEIKQDKEEIQKELTGSEEMEKSVEASISGFQKELEEKRLQETESSAKVSEWELKVEKMLQTQGFHQQNVDRINAEIETLKGELSEIEDGIAGNEESLKEKKEHIAEIEKTIEASHTSQDKSQKELTENIAKKEELSAKQKNFFTEREELSQQMTRLDKEVYRLNAQKEKMEEAMEIQINYMWDEYELTLSDAASLRKEELTDLSSMKKEISAIKDQIKKLGDVNVNAIEDYKNLMERYTFLKTLEGIITELDSAMRKQFQEKFAEINKEFDKVFKELFGGGRGTLELMEDEDILEAGIRIIAQPPGKKLQNMMQLSGGEKALTAISLLFAIQNLKPSPFCLLDEIEAALDESNVGRFAKYLHKLTKNTQFIVITHRRGTMEKADRLYGITMQEKGVSALVSVNLIDKELDN